MSPARTSILLVCTANQCRSPLAEAIAKRAAGDLPVDFTSAGLLEGGRSTPANGVRVAAELGLDLSGHVSRQFDPATAGEYAVILTMTRAQATDVIANQPELWPRVFTLKQFARWIRDSAAPWGPDLGSWLDEAAADRSLAEIVGSSPRDDVRDPLISPPRVWRSVARELQRNLSDILESLYPSETA